MPRGPVKLNVRVRPYRRSEEEEKVSIPARFQ